MPGKCSFNERWLENDDYKDWLQPDSSNKHMAACRYCIKKFDIENMGESALKSHMKGSKHCELKKSVEASASVKSFFAPKNAAASSRPREFTAAVAGESSSSARESARAPTLSSFVTKNDCLKSEIMWALNVMDKHYSYRSCEDVGKLFQEMFPDSEIAKSFTCGERKCAYLTCYGLAPYFQSMLVQQVSKSSEYVLLYDESLNRKSQDKQMDVHVRLWEADRVVTRYFSSQFMGHADSHTMLQHFNQCVEKLNLRHLWQVSMDGPNVNWKFIDSLQAQLKTDCDSVLLNIGSCGLHIVNGAFRTGFLSVDWKLNDLLSSLYWLLKDSPARREDYSSACGSTGVKFPLKFCHHRWLENVPVSERALEILPAVKTYLGKITEKEFKEPNTASYETVKAMTKDPLLTVKMIFFLSVAKQVAPFLTMYQTDAPMIPFLCEDLHRMLRGLMQRFIKPQVMKESSTLAKLMKIDLSKKENHRDVKRIDVGFVAENLLKQLSQTGKISELRELQFKTDCRNVLSAVVRKLLEKAPIKHTLVQCMSALDPRLIASNGEKCKENMKKMLKVLADAKKVNPAKCDEILRQFGEFIDAAASNPSDFRDFQLSDRVDILFHRHMAGSSKYSEIWPVCCGLLLLSHGQANVERGFSINKELEVENLHNESLVSQRIIVDHIRSVGGVLRVNISKELISYASTARQRYMAHLEEEKSKQRTAEKRQSICNEMEELKKKKRRLEMDVTALIKSADEFAEKAEATGQVTWISKSNSMRRTAKEKQSELDAVRQKIEEGVKECK